MNLYQFYVRCQEKTIQMSKKLLTGRHAFYNVNHWINKKVLF
jgi:hypothetical protein